MGQKTGQNPQGQRVGLLGPGAAWAPGWALRGQRLCPSLRALLCILQEAMGQEENMK